MPASDDFRLAILRQSPRERDRILSRRYRERRDRRAREELIVRYLPLANRIARDFLSGHESLDDLRQVAALGLTKAAERFNPDRDSHFAAFARVTISGELRRHYRDATWPVHVPRGLKDHARAVQ